MHIIVYTGLPDQNRGYDSPGPGHGIRVPGQEPSPGPGLVGSSPGLHVIVFMLRDSVVNQGVFSVDSGPAMEVETRVYFECRVLLCRCYISLFGFITQHWVTGGNNRGRDCICSIE